MKNQSPLRPRIEIPRDAIESFCRRWLIAEFALFGSVLRDDFRPDSDIDVLVTFGEGEHWSLFDLVGMKLELEELFGRSVDVVEKPTIEKSRNPYRRRNILDNYLPVYAA